MFQLLTGLRPPDVSMLDDTELFRERVEAATALQDRLVDRPPGARPRRPACRAADLGDLDDTRTGLVIDLLRSYRAVEAYDDVVDLVDAMPAALRSAPQVREHPPSRSTGWAGGPRPRTSCSS